MTSRWAIVAILSIVPCVAVVPNCRADGDSNQTVSSAVLSKPLPPGDESANFSIDRVLTDLDNPFGLAVRKGQTAEKHHVMFIAECGAGRVLRVTTADPPVAAS